MRPNWDWQKRQKNNRRNGRNRGTPWQTITEDDPTTLMVGPAVNGAILVTDHGAAKTAHVAHLAIGMIDRNNFDRDDRGDRRSFGDRDDRRGGFGRDDRRGGFGRDDRGERRGGFGRDDRRGGFTRDDRGDRRGALW